MDSHTDITEDDGALGRSRELPSRWHFLFTWPTLVLSAWTVYELTSQASLGIAFLCLKFGWESFRTAFWLRRRDPERGRGKMAFWIFVASGLWQAAATGAILMFAYTFALVGRRAPGQGPPREFIEAFSVAFFGFLLSSLVTLRALALAFWCRRKIWLDPGIHRARRYDVWPPTSSGSNKAATLLITSLIAVLLPICIVILCLIVAWTNPPGRDNVLAPLLFLGFVVLALPLAVLCGRDLVQRKVLARFPEECWGIP